MQKFVNIYEVSQTQPDKIILAEFGKLNLKCIFSQSIKYSLYCIREEELESLKLAINCAQTCGYLLSEFDLDFLS